MSNNTNDTFNNVFVPDSETARRFKEQVNAVLTSKAPPANTTIDMGSLPEIYTELGIADKELKTNVTTMLKALGVKGQNRHHVQAETLENLLALVHDPEAVCKSLSGSQNPNSYVAMLNAKTEDGKPVIAILRPSEDGKGYTFIPSVYEKDNFERYLAQFAQEGRGLYVKEKGSELWGRLQLPPRHNSEPDSSILTKEDIVKRIIQKNSDIRQTPREAEKTSKEADMADNLKQESPEETEAAERKPAQSAQTAQPAPGDNFANLAGGFAMAAGASLPHTAGVVGPEPPAARQNPRTESPREAGTTNTRETRTAGGAAAEAQARGNSPEERAFFAAIHQRKVVADALKAGTLSCLPGADGAADTEPAVNIVNGTRYHGANLLFLKEHQKQNGFPTAEYVTQDAVQKSGIPIRAGQHGVDIKINEKNEQSGEWEHKTVRLFNVAQSAKPWEMKKWAADQIGAEVQERQEFLKKQFGDSFVPQQKKEPRKGPDVVCSSTEPEKYLGQYLAAVSMGSKFKATPEQAAEFSKNFESALFAKNANGHSNPFELSKICGRANDVCKETVSQARARERAAQQQEQTQKRGRGI
jgi:hypothetical protein